MESGVLIVCAFVLVAIAGYFLVSSDSSARNKGTPPPDPLRVVGAQGVAQGNFVQEGIILLSGELWRAESESGIIAQGELVEVTELLPELRVRVKKVAVK